MSRVLGATARSVVFLVVGLVAACSSLDGPAGVPVPDAVSVRVGAGFTVVTWRAPLEDGAASTFVLRRVTLDGGGDAVHRTEIEVPHERRSYLDRDVTPGWRYRYEVALLTADGRRSAPGVATSEPVRAPERPAGGADGESFGLTVRALDERGNARPSARVTVVAVDRGGARAVRLDATSDDSGVATFEMQDALRLGDAPVVVQVVGGQDDATGVQLRVLASVVVPGVVTVDPNDPDTVELDVLITSGGDAANHLMQLVPGAAAAALGDAIDASTLPTRVRVSRGAWTAVVSGFRYPDDVGTQLWFDLLAERDGLVAFDTRDATSVTLRPRATLATSASIVSLFTCPMAQRPGLAIVSRYCLGDAELLLTPQPYGFEAQLRARVGPVDWIYTLETDERDLAAGDAQHVLDLGGGAHLDASLEVVVSDEDEGSITLRVSVGDDHGNALRSVLRREDGVSVEAPAIVRVLDPEGFVVSERSVAGNDLDGLSVPFPGAAAAGGYRVEVRYPIGPLASAPVGALLEVAAR